ncbi:MAG TPA: hypothetical protein VET27_15885 [Mycobacterium sp.]|nr:hypothetical protein [Mycobacterium sp.]
MTDDERVRPETVFRARWRERQTASVRTGELITQPGWIDAALVALGVLVAAGGITGLTVTVERTTTLSAVVQSTTVTAIRAGTDPAPGTAALYRDSSGATVDAIVVAVNPIEVIAQLDRPRAASAGALVLPAGRQPVLAVLLPRLG